MIQQTSNFSYFSKKNDANLSGRFCSTGKGFFV